MPTKNDKTKEQYILSLDYFSKLKFPNINKIEDLENLSLNKGKYNHMLIFNNTINNKQVFRNRFK
jgi:hypothetical protein